MASSRHIDIQVIGIARLLRKLNKTNPVYATGWVSALKEAASLVHGAMQDGAPGTLGARVTTKMQARPVPMWAKVGLFPMPKNKGFRYPGALQGGAMYHYRSGSNQGQQTKGWLKKPLRWLEGRIEGLLSKAGSEIERDWERN